MKSLLFLITATLWSLTSIAQDLIVKTNGDSIQVQILEIGTNTITYKKTAIPNGPSFVDNKSDVSFIKYSNGELQQFNKVGGVDAKKESATKEASKNESAQSNQSDGSKIKIESANGKYKISGQKASRREVDKQLATSKNPAILVPLKAMKMTSGAQTISKISSIPTTIVGIPASLVTLVDLINDARRHRDNTSTYVGAIGSVLGTLALPITNKILKKKSDGMRDKLIELYNVTN